MRLFTTYIICALALFCGSCSKDSGGSSSEQGEQLISIDPIIQSRASDSDFLLGDQIALTVVMSDQTVYAQNSPMSYDGAKFTSDLAWYDDSAATSTLTAYYPYTEGDELPTAFTIQSDQSAEGAYSASDLMVAQRSGALPSSSSTFMTFYHLLCSVVATVDNRGDQGVVSISIGGTYPSATLDVASKSVEVDSSTQIAEITTAPWSDGGYRAIFVPQTASLTFTVTLEDGSTMVDEKSVQTFEAGTQYNVSILIYEGGISTTISGAIDEWDDGGDIEIVEGVPFTEYDDYFVYDGVSYNIKTFDNGLTVMVDNMRYIPEGMSPSADPTDASGLWYTYSLAADATADYIATALTDDESVATYGYLYNFATAFGVDVTGDNYDEFEGTQGICPKGWHIPTQAEWHSLCGDGYGASDDSSAPFFDTSVGYGSIQKANSLGFNHTYPGSVTNDRYSTSYVSSDYTDSDSSESIVGKNSLSYYMSSTAQNYWESSDKACYYALYTSHASAYMAKGCISVMLCYEPYGVSLRCVKD